MEPRLSFCLPTFKQPESVERLLGQLALERLEKVEIVIRDDSPDQETEKIVATYKGRGLPVRYFHLPKEGVDEAVLFLIKEAKGEYIWWFGDDSITPGAIEGILAYLNENPEISLMLLNCRGEFSPPVFKYQKSFKFLDKNRVLEKVADMLGFISISVFKREEALKALPEAQFFKGTSWATLFVVLFILAHGKEHHFFKEVCVVSQERSPEQRLWYDPFQVFAINLFKVLSYFKNNFSKKSVRKMLSINFSSIWRSSLIKKAKSRKVFFCESSKFKALFKIYWGFPVFWVFLILYFLPAPILSLFYKVYKLLFPRTYIRIN